MERRIVKQIVERKIELGKGNNYWNSSNLTPKDPVVSNLCSQVDIQKAAEKAARRIARDKKKLEKENKEKQETA